MQSQWDQHLFYGKESGELVSCIGTSVSCG